MNIWENIVNFVNYIFFVDRLLIDRDCCYKLCKQEILYKYFSRKLILIFTAWEKIILTNEIREMDLGIRFNSLLYYAIVWIITLLYVSLYNVFQYLCFELVVTFNYRISVHCTLFNDISLCTVINIGCLIWFWQVWNVWYYIHLSIYELIFLFFFFFL